MYKYDRYAEYQTPCLERLRTARENGSRGLIVMAGGLGKTIVAARDVKTFLDEKLGKRVLFLCHDTGILAQNKKKFESILEDNYRCGLFIGMEKEFEPVDVLFASFQTMSSVSMWMHTFSADDFSYVIVDEAHHAPARTFKAVIDYFQPKFLLGLTATPDREDGKPLSDIFGEAIFTLDFVDAWAMGYLTGVDYQLVTDELSGLVKYLNPENHELISLKALNRKVFTPKRDEWLVKDIRARTAVRENPRMVVFCQTVRHAEHIARLLGSRVLHSKQSPIEQDQNLKDFRKGTITTLVVVDKLNEGIDVPEIDVIVRLRLTGSVTVFQQQLCRGLRICDGKENVLVLDYVSSCEQIEMLFDMERKLKEHADGCYQKGTGIDPEFIVTITGGGFHAEKADIVALIQRAKAGYHYSKEMLIETLQVLALELGHTPTRDELNAKPGVPSATAYTTVFGTWNDALMAAGFETNRRYGNTRESIITEIQKLAKELGRTPTVEDQKVSNLPSQTVIYDIFGTWNDALRAAGLEVNNEAYTKEQFITKLQILVKTLGRIPSSKELVKYPDMPSKAAYANAFGTWNAALRAAGFEPNRPVSEFTPDEIVMKLKAFGDEIGHLPTQDELDERAKTDKQMPTSNICIHAFSSWRKTLIAAGFKTKSLSQWTNEKMIQELQGRAKELGRVPTRRELTDDMPSSATYRNRFGSWNDALVAADLKPNKVRATD